MRGWSVFRKSMREQLRDPLALSLVLVFAPIFVALYRLLFPTGSTTYGVMILNQDAGIQQADGRMWNAGDELTAALQYVTYADGNPLLKVERVTDRAEGEVRLRERSAQVLLIVPPDFSRTLRSGDKSITSSVTFVGDLTQPYYAVAAVMASGTLDQYVQAATGQTHAIQVAEEPLGASGARTEFETYVPGLLVFAVMMLVFQSSMVIARDVEAGTLRRLQITRMTAFDYLGGVTASQVVIGLVAVMLTFVVAIACGFRSQGPMWVALLVSGIASLSIIGAGLIVACFSRNLTQAFLIANFPLALFMFFSGAIFPIPRINLFTLAGHSFALFDILPPSHAVAALNKIFVLGAGLSDVMFELIALTVLSIAYFAIGVWLFKRTHLKAG
jgi:ABC-2 type transport system permease protein